MRALAKVVQVMPARLRRRVEALRAVTVPASWGERRQATVDPAVLTTSRWPAGTPNGSGSPTPRPAASTPSRHVEPHRLVLLGRRWYLVGYDLDRQDWRSFRLDRLDRPRGTGARFRPRELPAADAAAFVRAGVGSAPAGYDVEVIVEAPAAAVRERIGRWSSVDEIDAGRCRVRMTADMLEWPVMGLGLIGAEFQVISPPELIESDAGLGRPVQPRRAAVG